MAKAPKDIKFVCTVTDCPNEGVEYLWGDPTETTAQCGGCGIVLYAIEVTA